MLEPRIMIEPRGLTWVWIIYNVLISLATDQNFPIADYRYPRMSPFDPNDLNKK